MNFSELIPTLPQTCEEAGSRVSYSLSFNTETSHYSLVGSCNCVGECFGVESVELGNNCKLSSEWEAYLKSR